MGMVLKQRRKPLLPPRIHVYSHLRSHNHIHVYAHT